MNIPKISVARYSSSLASRETPEQLAAQARIQGAFLPQRRKKLSPSELRARKNQRSRKWRARNLERALAREQCSREQRRDKANEYWHNYYRANREKLLVRHFLERKGERVSINDISGEMVQIYRNRATKG